MTPPVPLGQEPGGAAAARPRAGDLTVGDQVAARTVHVTRADLVHYAGASGDRNPIHWSDAAARAAGLPGVVAHGMLTMALAASMVSDWAGDPAAVLELGVRFTGLVPVDAESGVDVELSASVRSLDVGAGTAVLDLLVRSGGSAVLGRARATVSLT